jgi:hypothetical protein
VQYNDWKGTAAADNSDHHDIHDYLTKKGLMTDNEFLLSVTFYRSEGFVRIGALLLKDANKYETAEAALANIAGPIPVKRVDVEISTEKFMELFKRFNVVLCWKLNIQGREAAPSPSSA